MCLSVESFEFHERIFGPSIVNILTSVYCKRSILVQVDLHYNYPTINRCHTQKHLIKAKKNLIKVGKNEKKILERSGIFVRGKKWEPCCLARPV